MRYLLLCYPLLRYLLLCYLLQCYPLQCDRLLVLFLRQPTRRGATNTCDENAAMLCIDPPPGLAGECSWRTHPETVFTGASHNNERSPPASFTAVLRTPYSTALPPLPVSRLALLCTSSRMYKTLSSYANRGNNFPPNKYLGRFVLYRPLRDDCVDYDHTEECSRSSAAIAHGGHRSEETATMTATTITKTPNTIAQRC